MSVAFAIPNAILEEPCCLTNQRAASEIEDDLRSDVPSITSLHAFASKLHLRPRHRRGQEAQSFTTAISLDPVARATDTGERTGQATAKGSLKIHDADNKTILVQTLPGTDGASRRNQNESDYPSVSATAEHVSEICVTVVASDSRESGAISTSRHNAQHASRTTDAEEETTRISQTEAAEGRSTLTLTAIDIGSGEESNESTDVEKNDDPKSDTNDTTLSSSSTTQAASTTATTPSASNPSISTKGKESVRGNRLSTVNIHVPHKKFARIIPIRRATAGTVKAELVCTEHSVADRERLAKFSRVLSAAKYRIELFGKELPLTRFSLVQVTEGTSSPVDYICVHGLYCHADITRFHTVMSHKRYRPLYQPLKLCYDTARLKKVGLTNPVVAESSKQQLSAFLSPAMEPAELEFGDALEPFHFYHPVADDETYCGALFQTVVDGKPWISTLGGTIRVGDDMYIMAFQHAPSTSFESKINFSSFADTLIEEECKTFGSHQDSARADSETPLVFSSHEIPEEPDVPHIPEADGALPPISVEWKKLSLDGEITVGSEWCLLPVKDQSLLPNFIDESIDGSNDFDKRRRRYLDQISEPRGGSSACIAAGIDSQPLGTILGNSSFIVAGGTDGLIEVWTVALNEGQSIQKGDSGSWVIDTTDPVQYKVVGSAIATSDGAAHFIRIVDQFYEMENSLGGSKSVHLVPAFRALINRANHAFLRNDLSFGNLIDEALSPGIMAQFQSDWFMTGLRIFLGDYADNQQNGEAHEDHSSPARRMLLKSLLLHYGCELLDSLLDSTAFRKRHAGELNTSHWQTLEALENVLLPARRDRLKRLEDTDISKIQSYDHATHTPLTHMSEKKQTPSAIPGHPEPPGRVKQYVFGLEVYPKAGSINKMALMGILLLTILAEGVASASGAAAAAVTFLVQFSDNHSPTDMTMTQYVTLGAVVGPISVTVTLFQVLLIFFSRTYHWSLLCGSRAVGIPSPGWTRVLFFIVLSLVSGMLRTMLSALYVAHQRGLQNDGTIYAASAVAAVPSILSTASPSIYWTLADLYYRLKDTKGVARTVKHKIAPLWICQGVFLIAMIGFDSLAGYVFGRMSRDSGRFIPSPASAAAGATVLSTLTTALVSLPLARLCLHLYRRTIVAQRSPDNADLEVAPLGMVEKPKPRPGLFDGGIQLTPIPDEVDRTALPLTQPAQPSTNSLEIPLASPTFKSVPQHRTVQDNEGSHSGEKKLPFDSLYVETDNSRGDHGDRESQIPSTWKGPAVHGSTTDKSTVRDTTDSRTRDRSTACSSTKSFAVDLAGPLSTPDASESSSDNPERVKHQIGRQIASSSNPDCEPFVNYPKIKISSSEVDSRRWSGHEDVEFFEGDPYLVVDELEHLERHIS